MFSVSSLRERTKDTQKCFNPNGVKDFDFI